MTSRLQKAAAGTGAPAVAILAISGIALLLAACAPTPEIPPAPPVPPPVTQGTPERCEDCHNADKWDPDGAGPSPAAPNVMGGENWGYLVNGHGAFAAGRPERPIACADCHLLGGHHLDGTLNTLDWPGQDNVQTENTSHLVDGYFGGGEAGEMQKAFDDYCSSTCHHPSMDMRHSQRIDPDGPGPQRSEPDNEMLFGDSTSNPNPKKVRPQEILWGDDPYRSGSEKEKMTPGVGNDGDPRRSYWFPWTISDHTTRAAAPPYYGTCASCHDPHGTAATDTSRGSSHMVRYNWKRPPASDPPFFCNAQCHRM